MYVIICPIDLFLMAIVLSVHLWFTTSDYPFGIFKPFVLIYYIYYSVFDCRERGMDMPHENLEEFKKDVVLYEPNSLEALLNCFKIFMPVIA